MQTKADVMSETQQGTWKNSKNVGGILIKKACEHSTCNHFRCERKDLRINGIDV